jgi:hypothetical protein
VAGAFKSVLVCTFLDDYFDAATLREDTNPGAALSQLHQYLLRVIEPGDDTAHEASSVGIDALVFTYDEASSTLHYAGSTLALMVVTSAGELQSACAGTAGIGPTDIPADTEWVTRAVAVPAGSVVTIATDSTLKQLGAAPEFAGGLPSLAVFVQQHRQEPAPTLLAAILQRDAESQRESQRREALRLLIFRPKS